MLTVLLSPLAGVCLRGPPHVGFFSVHSGDDPLWFPGPPNSPFWPWLVTLRMVLWTLNKYTLPRECYRQGFLVFPCFCPPPPEWWGASQLFFSKRSHTKPSLVFFSPKNRFRRHTLPFPFLSSSLAATRVLEKTLLPLCYQRRSKEVKYVLNA